MSGARVAITGVGITSALGVGRAAVVASLKAGRSGVDELSLFDCEDMPSVLAAEVGEFNVDDYLSTGKTYLDRAAELAMAATALAIIDSGLDLDRLDRDTTGLALGSAWGTLDTMALFFEDFLVKGPRRVKPFLFPHTYSNTVASLLAIEHDLRGYHTNVASGFVSASLGILAAFDRIRRGELTVAFAGGYDALSEVRFTGRSLQGLLSEGADERCAPFDRNRNGMVLGEAGAMLVLEDRAHAQERGAEILGELLGVETAGALDPADPAALERTMTRACRSAGAEWSPDLVIASANGSVVSDRMEATALVTALGERVGDVAVTSVKPLTGETAGAGGAVQVAAALASIETGVVPPILNLVDPEPDLPSGVVVGSPVTCDPRCVLVNSVDPGGAAACIAVGAV